MSSYYNVMEKLVIEKLDELWNSLDTCKCDRCRNDIIALALNQVGSKYVVSKEGELYSKASTLTQDNEVAIIKAIALASRTVKDKPNHS
ncbi:MAG: late competence development ComFB family protein [Anaerocolumna sp.]